MNCRLLPVSLAFFILPCSLFAQPKQGQARLDSLLAELPKMKPDSDGVKLLSWISYGYRRINPEAGIGYAGRALALAQKIGWRKGEAMAYNDFGNYHNQGNYPAALNAFFKSLSIYEELGDKSSIATIANNIGNVYRHQWKLSKAMEYYNKSLAISTELGEKLKIEHALGNIGIVYEDLHEYLKALEYKKKALALAEELNDNEGIITQTENIGGTYGNLRQFPEALVYSFKSLRAARAAGDKQSIALNLGNIGETYVDIATDSAATQPDSLIPAGKPAILEKGIDYLNQGIIACRECQYFDAICEYAEYLSRAYVRKGDYKNALAAYQQYTSVRDSLYNIASSEKMSDLETKRAVQLKDKDIQIGKLQVEAKRNERYGYIAGIILLLAIMGILGRSYKLLSKEKKRSDDLLLNILPSEVAQELKDKGGAEAKQYDEVSVLFTDFVHFTSVAEQLSPQQLVKELHECFTGFDAIIVRHGLEKIKTIGDAYLAVCGLPASDSLHAQKAVQAGIEIRDFIEERRTQGRVFEIRVGVNSGPVVAGIVGVKKFAYDIWGDTVNMAARMEQHGQPGTVNISQSTYELVKNDYRCEHRGRIAAKNKGEVEMYFAERK